MVIEQVQAVVLILLFTALWTLVTILIANWPKFAKFLRRIRSKPKHGVDYSNDIFSLVTANEYVGCQGVSKWRRVVVKFDPLAKSIEIFDMPDMYNVDAYIVLRRISFVNETFLVRHEDRLSQMMLGPPKSDAWRRLNEAALVRAKLAQTCDASAAYVLYETGDSNNRLTQLDMRDKDADLVLQFDDDESENRFKFQLASFLRRCNFYMYRCQASPHSILNNAFTIEIFRKQLPRLLRSAVLSLEGLPKTLSPRLASASISRVEFANLLRTSQDHPYTSRAFDQMDKDCDGFIKVATLLDWFARISALNLRDRIFATFQFFDSNRDGFLTYEELVEIVFELVPHASDREIVRFFEDVIASCDFSASEQIGVSFETFWLLFQTHFSKMVAHKIEPPSPITVALRQRESDKGSPELLTVSSPPSHSYSCAIFVNRRQLFWGVVFSQLCFGLILAEIPLLFQANVVNALRSIGYASLNIATLTLCSLLLLRCRCLLTRLRNTDFRLIFPFASLVAAEKNLTRVHRWAILAHASAYLMRQFFNGGVSWRLSLIGIHLAVFSLAFHRSISLSQNNNNFLNKMRREIFLVPIVLVIYGFLAFNFARQGVLPIHLFAIALSFLAFTVDRFFCIKTRHYDVKVVSSRLLPCEVIRLEFERPREMSGYKPGQYVHLCVPGIERDGYHPLSLTSSPDEPTLSAHILPVGPWSVNFAKLLLSQNHNSVTKLEIEGPFSGTALETWHQCDVAVLFGYGIVGSPFASLLKHIRNEIIKARHSDGVMPFKCLNVYFVFITGQSSEWFNEIVEQLERVDDGSFVNVEMFYPELGSNRDLRALVHYQEAVRAESAFTKNALTRLRARPHFGWPNFDALLRRIVRRNSTARRINVVTSAPTNLVYAMEQAVSRINKAMMTPMASPVFNHSYEAL